MVPKLLRHLHLTGITPFQTISAIQTNIAATFHAQKALQSPSASTPALPLILTSTPTPTYTLGRRERDSLTADQITALEAPFSLSSLDSDLKPFSQKLTERATVVQTARGGQITYHGRGQLLIYPLLDLKAISTPLFPKGLTARCYVNVLEEATIRTLARYGIAGIRTENPGVWVDGDRKIAALGVHLRRNVTRFGVGLNLTTPAWWWRKIVACGLEGKTMVNMKECLEEEKKRVVKHRNLRPIPAAEAWVQEFGKCVWGEEWVNDSVDVGSMASSEKKRWEEPESPTELKVKWTEMNDQERIDDNGAATMLSEERAAK